MAASTGGRVDLLACSAKHQFRPGISLRQRHKDNRAIRCPPLHQAIGPSGLAGVVSRFAISNSPEPKRGGPYLQRATLDR
jgi:hypothetical protein